MTEEYLIDGERLRLREIDLSDTDAIVEWRSDPNAFRFFRNPIKITKEDHIRWFQNSYSKNNSRLDLMAFDNDGNRVGVFGLNIDNDCAEVSYIVAPNQRGKGYATEGAVSVMLYAIKKYHVTRFKADIHSGNTPSIKLIDKLHFVRTSAEAPFERYELLVDKRLFFRVDGNSKIGFGHIMRCVAIANAAKRAALEPIFIISDEACKDVIDSYQIDTITVQDTINSDVSVINKIVDKMGASCVLFDSYQINPEYLKDLACSSLYFDDFNSDSFFANTIIRYTPPIKGSAPLSNEATDYLFGLKYVPLRDDFVNCSTKTINPSIKKIVVIAGGSNPNHISSKIASFLAKNLSAEIIAIDGSSSFASSSLPNLKVVEPTNHIADYLKGADLVISSGGVTLYELCACGTPAISFLVAENQRNNVGFFSSKKLIPFAGTDKDHDLFANILKKINEMSSKSLRESISLNMQRTIDGNGAERILDRMVRYNLNNNLLKKS